jgi:hypothetical protein
LGWNLVSPRFLLKRATPVLALKKGLLLVAITASLAATFLVGWLIFLKDPDLTLVECLAFLIGVGSVFAFWKNAAIADIQHR